MVSIWAGTRGKLDEVAVEDILKFESELLDHLRRNTKILTTLRETNVLDADTEKALEAEVDGFLKKFRGDGADVLGAPGSEEFTALEDEDINQEKIVRRKR